jgi:hypothetical protein
MSSLSLGLGLALLASLALNSGFLAQHAGARDAPTVSPRHPVATLRGLLGSPIWTVGLALGLVGWMLHIGALANAPLSLVQPFAAGGLALAVPAAARFLGERLSHRERIAVATMAVALVGLSLGARATPATPTFGVPPMMLYLLAAAVLAALLAASPAGERRPHALGAAAGVLYGAADTATKAATAHASSLSLAGPWVLAVVVASVAAFFAFQRGLQIGQAIPVIALMTVLTNVVAVLGGLLVFSEPLGGSPALAALHLVAFGLAGGAAWLLAGTHARLAERGAALRARDPRAPVGFGVPSEHGS